MRENMLELRLIQEVSATRKEEEYYRLSKTLFRLLAPFYYIMFAILTFGAPLKLREKVVDFADLPKASRVLDVATGTGEQAYAFAERGFNVVGVDLSEDMLEVAKKKKKNGKAEFEMADATRLPFENESFDASCVSFALHDMIVPIREKVLTEMSRVTKKNGTLIIVDYDLPQERIRRSLVYNFVRLYEVYYQEFIKGDLEAMLRKSGIETRKRRPVLFGAGRILKGMKVAR